jgi:hypothetical protein
MKKSVKNQRPAAFAGARNGNQSEESGKPSLHVRGEAQKSLVHSTRTDPRAEIKSLAQGPANPLAHGPEQGGALLATKFGAGRLTGFGAEHYSLGRT